MAVIIKNMRWIALFGLIFSLVLTSHFSILELVSHCSHHHSEASESHDTAATPDNADSCPGQHRCHHASTTYMFPPVLAELAPALDLNTPPPSHTRCPQQPFLDTPFQPPRLNA